MPTLGVIICSTRPGRVGPVFAKWFTEVAPSHGTFDVTLIDLVDVNLPLFDEPKLPSTQEYEHAHTRLWSQMVSKLDAVVFVTPEYNHGPPPAAINALTFVTREWAYMPVGFLGYSLGLTAAARSVQALKLITNALRMMPIPESILFPNYQQILDQTGALNVPPNSEQVVGAVLHELSRWTGALAKLRAAALKGAK